MITFKIPIREMENYEGGQTSLIAQEFGESKACIAVNQTGGVIFPFKVIGKNILGKCSFGYKDLYNAIGLKYHDGWDLRVIDGKDILASTTGKVRWAGGDQGYGRVVFLESDPFVWNNQEVILETVYAHLQSFRVKENDRVEAGQVIAQADNSGMSSGSHLHWGTRLRNAKTKEILNYNNGTLGYINPYLILQSYLIEKKTAELEVAKAKVEEIKIENIKQQISLMEQIVLLFQKLFEKLVKK